MLKTFELLSGRVCGLFDPYGAISAFDSSLFDRLPDRAMETLVVRKSMSWHLLQGRGNRVFSLSTADQGQKLSGSILSKSKSLAATEITNEKLVSGQKTFPFNRPLSTICEPTSEVGSRATEDSTRKISHHQLRTLRFIYDEHCAVNGASMSDLSRTRGFQFR